jgi:transcription antitermination factor NusG
VSNLLFIKAKESDKELRKSILELNYAVRLMRKSKGSDEVAKIPARQMYEFQAMCNPDLVSKQIISSDEAKLKKGQQVLVTHGPLKGLRGRLVRTSKKYYLLKEIPGIAVMMNVSRWCCEPI